jgi:EAL domain-containing protein (putative c-di-GMP-specific phosphodiesterase class I)
VFDGAVRERRRRSTTRRTWAEKLRAGLESDAFLLDAQPIVDLATGDVRQYELLLRLRDDDGAIVRPLAFLAVAERYGLMRAIDEWVVRRAIGLARARVDAGDPVTLAVNVSGESLGDAAFLPLVVDELLAVPDVGAHLVFEITERTAVADLEQAKRLMARLGEFGCRFALDDFGAGTASFAYLKHLPVDFLKLDGEFTRGLPHDRTDCEIVSAVVGAARGLGKTVIAECVEDEAILEAVRILRVDYAQGLHVGRPERAADLLALTV